MSEIKAGLSPREERDLVLEAAAKLLAAGWTKGTSARDAGGNPVYFGSPDARSFCLGGAIWRAARDNDGSTFAAHRAEKAVRCVAKRSIVLFNDKTAQDVQEVLQVVQMAKEQRL